MRAREAAEAWLNANPRATAVFGVARLADGTTTLSAYWGKVVCAQRSRRLSDGKWVRIDRRYNNPLPADAVRQTRDHYMGHRRGRDDRPARHGARVVCHSGWRRPSRLCGVPGAFQASSPARRPSRGVAHSPVRRARASLQSAPWMAGAQVRLGTAAWLAARPVLAPGPARMAVLGPGRPGAGWRAEHQVHPQDVKIAVAARDGGRCRQCGSTTDLHFDHVIPWSKGGANTVTNIQLLCGPCNRRKGADDIPVGV
jgi:hypothetical protein